MRRSGSPERANRSRRRRRPWLIATLALYLSLVPGVEVAQGQSSKEHAEPAAYREAIQQGLSEYQLGNYQEARDQFARAHALNPNARTLRGLGFTAFELRNYIEAESYLQSALDSRDKPLDGRLRAEAEEMLARARGYVGGITLNLQPVNTIVVVDGIRSTEARNALRLDVGDHVLEFRADGFLAERRAVRVQGGQTQALTVVLSRLSATDSLAPARDAQRSAQQPPLYKRWWLWTVVCVVAGGAALGIGIALTRRQATEYHGVPSENTPAGLSIEALRLR